MKFYRLVKLIFTPSAFKLGLIATFAIFYISYKYYTTPIREMESHPILNLINISHQKSIDIRMTGRGELPITNQVAILAIDEESIERFGRWPWPRKVMADIVDELKKNDVKTIGFDIIFSEKENDTLFAKSVENFSDNIVLGTYFDQSYEFASYQIACTQAIDESMAESHSLENQNNPILSIDQSATDLPLAIQEYLSAVMKKIEADTQKNTVSAYPHEIRKKTLENKENFCLNFLSSSQSIESIEKNWILFQAKSSELQNLSASEWINNFKTSSLHNPIHHAGRFWINVPEISEKSKHYAYFNAFLDSDGYIRRTKLVARYGTLTVPSLALKTVLTAKNLSAMVTLDQDPNYPANKRISEFSLIDNNTGNSIDSIPVNNEGALNINYAGPQKTFAYIGVHDLLNNSDKLQITQRINKKEQKLTVNKKEFLKNKIILIGATAVAIYDLRVTPFAENFPGVEVHANIIENILSKSYFKSLPDEPIYMLLFILGFGALLSFGVAKTGALYGSLLSLGSLIGIYLFDRFVLFSEGYVVGIVIPILLVVIIYILLTFYKYLTEERTKKELKGTFQKYVSPSVVNEILSNPDKIRLGGRKENMTVMFSDLRGFTTLSEKLDPEVLSTFLNRYLTPMTRIVFKHNGTLDKYIGDAIMAFWGAPLPLKTHTHDCCLAALEMLEKLKELNNEFESEQLPPLDIGIGINTGDMSVGNMGSDIVRSYTVMGDSVNLASRLEGINKNYGTKIIISDSSYEQIKEHFFVRPLDSVRVKGKLKPVRIYELISTKAKTDPALKDTFTLFEQACKEYYSRKFEVAKEIFGQVLNRIPHDIPSKIYIERCQVYMQNPPPESWDGVYEFHTK